MKLTDGGGNGAIEAFHGGRTGGVTSGRYDDKDLLSYYAQPVQENSNLFHNYSDAPLTDAKRKGSIFS